MFIYHGRKLSISDELLSKYRHHIGNDLSESWADLYVHNKYIHQSDEPLKLIPQLTDEELCEVISMGMCGEISLGIGRAAYDIP